MNMDRGNPSSLPESDTNLDSKEMSLLCSGQIDKSYTGEAAAPE